MARHSARTALRTRPLPHATKTDRYRQRKHYQMLTRSTLTITALALSILVCLARLPHQVRLFLQPALPVVALWPDAEAQRRVQYGEVPYDLLRAADGLLPARATVLLVTPGEDVRHREYPTFHRTLYLLAPRPVWWLSPAPSDGTWESRWWISAPLLPETVQSVAAERGAEFLLAIDLPILDLGGTQVARWERGYLVQLKDSPLQLVARSSTLMQAAPGWPWRLALAVGAIFSLGSLVLSFAARLGYRAKGVEAVALSWVLGAGLTSLGMLWLNALGLGLGAQILLLSLVAGVWLAGYLLVGLRYSKGQVARGTGHEVPEQSVVEGEGGTPHLTHRTSHAEPALGLDPSPNDRRSRLWMGLLLLILAAQVAYVALLAVGQPLAAWDSWSSWGMRARTIFLEQGITAAVYADPSRASTLPHYPLLVPLLQAWLYGWLRAADDRLAGVVPLLFYSSLIGVCYAVARGRQLGRPLALLGACLVASLPWMATLAGLTFVDGTLAALATVAVLYLVLWFKDGARGALVVAALAGGLLPWAKQDGLLLLATLGLSLLLVGWRHPRARLGAGAFALAGILVGGPWWVFVSQNGTITAAFGSLAPAQLLANLDRVPFIARTALVYLMSPDYGFVWPLAALLGLVLWVRSRGAPTRRDDSLHWDRLLPLTAVLYLGFVSLTFLASSFVPYQQHVLSSFFRLVAQVVALPVMWMVFQGQRSVIS